MYIVKDAEERGTSAVARSTPDSGAGLVRPGGTIVEGTAGNTGIGLAHVCRSRGYKCVIYMPDTQSQEKIDLLRLLGAEVYPVPGSWRLRARLTVQPYLSPILRTTIGVRIPIMQH